MQDIVLPDNNNKSNPKKNRPAFGVPHSKKPLEQSKKTKSSIPENQKNRQPRRRNTTSKKWFKRKPAKAHPADFTNIKIIDTFEKTPAAKPKNRPLLRFKRPKFSRQLLSKKMMIATAFLLIIAIASALQQHRAVVTVTPWEAQFRLAETIALYADPSQGTPTYTTMIVSEQATASLTPTIAVRQQSYATGTVTIFNNDSSQNITLPANTILEANNGVTYTFDSQFDIVVPGVKVENGQALPGSVEAPIKATKIGPDSNQGPTDFIFPQFAGTTKVKTIFARSSSDLQGGFSGTQYQYDPEVALQKFDQSIQQTLPKFLDSIQEYIPPEHISIAEVVEDSRQDTINNVIAVASEDSQTSKDFTVDLAITHILVHKHDIESYLQQKFLQGQQDNFHTDITNWPEISLHAGSDRIDLTKNDTVVNLTIGGQATFTWQVFASTIANSLAGKHKEYIEAPQYTFDRLPIESASIEIFPSWKKSLPVDPNKITIQFAQQ